MLKNKAGRFFLLTALGSAVIAVGFLICGSVVARALLKDPPLPPGFIYFDSPSDSAEWNTTRPIWLTVMIVGPLLSVVCALFVRHGFGAWTATFGLCNPLTFFFGWLIFVFSPWHGFAPGSYQMPLHPLVLLFTWLMVFAAAFLSRTSQRIGATSVMAILRQLIRNEPARRAFREWS